MGKSSNLWSLRVECTHDERRLLIERVKLNVKHFEERDAPDAIGVRQDGERLGLDSRFLTLPIRREEVESFGTTGKPRFRCYDCTGPHSRPLDVVLTWQNLDWIVGELYVSRAALWPNNPPRIELTALAARAARM